MYPQSIIQQTKVFKALSHERRLEIVRLIDTQTLSVTQIYQMLDLPQANVSQHLKILKESSLVISHKSGKEIYYRLSDVEVLNILSCLEIIIANQSKTKKRKVTDPVCQMTVQPSSSSFQADYEGSTYYFCASGCQKKFVNQPEKYVRTNQS